MIIVVYIYLLISLLVAICNFFYFRKQLRYVPVLNRILSSILFGFASPVFAFFLLVGIIKGAFNAKY